MLRVIFCTTAGQKLDWRIVENSITFNSRFTYKINMRVSKVIPTTQSQKLVISTSLPQALGQTHGAGHAADPAAHRCTVMMDDLDVNPRLVTPYVHVLVTSLGWWLLFTGPRLTRPTPATRRSYPVNTKHLYNICTMLDQRRNVLCFLGKLFTPRVSHLISVLEGWLRKTFSISAEKRRGSLNSGSMQAQCKK